MFLPSKYKSPSVFYPERLVYLPEGGGAEKPEMAEKEREVAKGMKAEEFQKYIEGRSKGLIKWTNNLYDTYPKAERDVAKRQFRALVEMKKGEIIAKTADETLKATELRNKNAKEILKVIQKNLEGLKNEVQNKIVGEYKEIIEDKDTGKITAEEQDVLLGKLQKSSEYWTRRLMGASFNEMDQICQEENLNLQKEIGEPWGSAYKLLLKKNFKKELMNMDKKEARKIFEVLITDPDIRIDKASIKVKQKGLKPRDILVNIIKMQGNIKLEELRQEFTRENLAKDKELRGLQSLIKQRVNNLNKEKKANYTPGEYLMKNTLECAITGGAAVFGVVTTFANMLTTWTDQQFLRNPYFYLGIAMAGGGGYGLYHRGLHNAVKAYKDTAEEVRPRRAAEAAAEQNLIVYKGDTNCFKKYFFKGNKENISRLKTHLKLEKTLTLAQLVELIPEPKQTVEGLKKEGLSDSKVASLHRHKLFKVLLDYNINEDDLLKDFNKQVNVYKAPVDTAAEAKGLTTERLDYHKALAKISTLKEWKGEDRVRIREAFADKALYFDEAIAEVDRVKLPEELKFKIITDLAPKASEAGALKAIAMLRAMKEPSAIERVDVALKINADRADSEKIRNAVVNMIINTELDGDAKENIYQRVKKIKKIRPYAYKKQVLDKLGEEGEYANFILTTKEKENSKVFGGEHDVANNKSYRLPPGYADEEYTFPGEITGYAAVEEGILVRFMEDSNPKNVYSLKKEHGEIVVREGDKEIKIIKRKVESTHNNEVAKQIVNILDAAKKSFGLYTAEMQKMQTILEKGNETLGVKIEEVKMPDGMTVKEKIEYWRQIAAPKKGKPWALDMMQIAYGAKNKDELYVNSDTQDGQLYLAALTKIFGEGIVIPKVFISRNGIDYSVDDKDLGLTERLYSAASHAFDLTRDDFDIAVDNFNREEVNKRNSKLLAITAYCLDKVTVVAWHKLIPVSEKIWNKYQGKPLREALEKASEQNDISMYNYLVKLDFKFTTKKKILKINIAQELGFEPIQITEEDQIIAKAEKQMRQEVNEKLFASYTEKIERDLDKPDKSRYFLEGYTALRNLYKQLKDIYDLPDADDLTSLKKLADLFSRENAEKKFKIPFYVRTSYVGGKPNNYRFIYLKTTFMPDAGRLGKRVVEEIDLKNLDVTALIDMLKKEGESPYAIKAMSEGTKRWRGIMAKLKDRENGGLAAFSPEERKTYMEFMNIIDKADKSKAVMEDLNRMKPENAGILGMKVFERLAERLKNSDERKAFEELVTEILMNKKKYGIEKAVMEVDYSVYKEREPEWNAENLERDVEELMRNEKWKKYQIKKAELKMDELDGSKYLKQGVDLKNVERYLKKDTIESRLKVLEKNETAYKTLKTAFAVIVAAWRNVNNAKYLQKTVEAGDIGTLLKCPGYTESGTAIRQRMLLTAAIARIKKVDLSGAGLINLEKWSSLPPVKRKMLFEKYLKIKPGDIKNDPDEVFILRALVWKIRRHNQEFFEKMKTAHPGYTKMDDKARLFYEERTENKVKGLDEIYKSMRVGEMWTKVDLIKELSAEDVKKLESLKEQYEVFDITKWKSKIIGNVLKAKEWLPGVEDEVKKISISPVFIHFVVERGQQIRVPAKDILKANGDYMKSRINLAKLDGKYGEKFSDIENGAVAITKLNTLDAEQILDWRKGYYDLMSEISRHDVSTKDELNKEIMNNINYITSTLKAKKIVPGLKNIEKVNIFPKYIDFKNIGTGGFKIGTVTIPESMKVERAREILQACIDWSGMKAEFKKLRENKIVGDILDSVKLREKGGELRELLETYKRVSEALKGVDKNITVDIAENVKNLEEIVKIQAAVRGLENLIGGIFFEVDNVKFAKAGGVETLLALRGATEKEMRAALIDSISVGLKKKMQRIEKSGIFKDLKKLQKLMTDKNRKYLKRLAEDHHILQQQFNQIIEKDDKGVIRNKKDEEKLMEIRARSTQLWHLFKAREVMDIPEMKGNIENIVIKTEKMIIEGKNDKDLTIVDAWKPAFTNEIIVKAYQNLVRSEKNDAQLTLEDIQGVKQYYKLGGFEEKFDKWKDVLDDITKWTKLMPDKVEELKKLAEGYHTLYEETEKAIKRGKDKKIIKKEDIALTEKIGESYYRILNTFKARKIIKIAAINKDIATVTIKSEKIIIEGRNGKDLSITDAWRSEFTEEAITKAWQNLAKSKKVSQVLTLADLPKKKEEKK